MNHKHFNSIPSTQVYLKNNLEELKLNDNNVLISCSLQTEGVGRAENKWDSYPNGLAMSFTLKPHSLTSLTPLEIGIIIINFIKTKYGKNLFLKWPNDILTADGQKCGGILCQYIDSSTVIVGVGLNLGKLELPINNCYGHGIGNIDQTLELNCFDQEMTSAEFYSEALVNRINCPLNLKKLFESYCYHINKKVLITDDGKKHIGIFRGIGNNGEALVESELIIHSFFSSSLTILN